MPKVKIVIASENGYVNDYDSYSLSVIRAGITDWEEVSEEDYEYLLRERGYNLDKAMKLPEGSWAMVVKQDEEPISNRIESITKLIKKMEEDRAKQELERKLKKEAEALKRRLKKEAKTEADELALLAALKAKHEGN